MNKVGLGLVFILSFALFACTEKEKKKTRTPVPSFAKVSPDFNADSSYHFIEKQLEFGPRVPNTPEHEACAKWLYEKLKLYTPNVIMQRALLTAHDGVKLNSSNIIASFSPEKEKRVLISAHWDTRPWADEEMNPELHNKPIPGANDAGSGVGVILEIARILKSVPPSVGVDLILWDSEDYGKPDVAGDSYCLGSQYWAANPHVSNYKALYGVNLDMVGAHGARFTKEGYSMQYAPQIVSKVWYYAHKLGYMEFFVDVRDYPITDDHLYMNSIANIPTIDIIHRDSHDNGFFPHWHTMGDDLSVISRKSLKATGQTVLELIYREK